MQVRLEVDTIGVALVWVNVLVEVNAAVGKLAELSSLLDLCRARILSATLLSRFVCACPSCVQVDVHISISKRTTQIPSHHTFHQKATLHLFDVPIGRYGAGWDIVQNVPAASSAF